MCKVCLKNGINVKQTVPDQYDYLINLIDHVNQTIKEETVDDEEHVRYVFSQLITHCIPKRCPNKTKNEIANEYNERIKNGSIKHHIIFEKLTFQITNGELCISVPSQALESCPFNCAFCPTGSGVAKSYTSDQPVFAKLQKNNNNLQNYMLNHMTQQYANSFDVSKLAMRHLGGTFSTYPKLYRFQYSRDIFYSANVLPLIINNSELFTLAKKSFRTCFDQDIKKQLPKPSNQEAIDVIELEIAELKILNTKSFQDKILKLEEQLILEYTKSLEMEQILNVTAPCRVVSYSIETRPDTINNTSLSELLKLGVTIIELGLQSPNNEILKINQRGHTVQDSERAIKKIKDTGFHVHGQWMMDLLGSTKESDMQDLQDILSPRLRCDQLKFYPHLKMPGTLSKDLLDDGTYTSWVENDMKGFLDLCVNFISNIDETTRIVRIQRDLPKASVKIPNGYTNDQPSNLEQIVTNQIYSTGKTREDIRHHEPGLRFANIDDIKYCVNITHGDIFISAESYICNDIKRKIKDFRIVWGYCRLRIVDENEDSNYIKFFKNNNKYGRIRELKVNGSVQSVGTNGKSVQHRGIGSTMLKIAEMMAYKYNMTHVTVTSAVGVRDYYRLKHGYQLDDCGLMWKKLDNIKLYKMVPISNTKHMIIFDENKNLNKYLIPGSIVVVSLIIGYLFYRKY